MKKTSVIAINLKSVRIPLLICTLITVISLSLALAKSLPPVTLSRDTLNWILSSNTVFSADTPSFCAAYSLLIAHSSPEKEKEAPSPRKEEPLPIVTPAAVNTDSKIEISNSTELNINPHDYLTPAPAFLKENFSVLIVHTHTTESYTPSENYNYTPSDTDRTTDKNFNMIRVGNEIERVLTAGGIKVYHDTTMNDYPSYNGSYNRSAKSVENHIKNDPSIRIILDVHRDAIEGKNGKKVKYTTEIDGKAAAKIMLVAGSNQSGLKHDNWEENMRFASQLQKHTLSLYPTLCRPINFRAQRFNQQLAPGAVIVEVGTNGNTLDEAILGAHYFAVALTDFIGTQKGSI